MRTINNQEQIFIHGMLANDLAYKYSLENEDVRNMQMVLRAHKEKFDIESATLQLKVGLEIVK